MKNYLSLNIVYENKNSKGHLYEYKRNSEGENKHRILYINRHSVLLKYNFTFK